MKESVDWYILASREIFRHRQNLPCISVETLQGRNVCKYTYKFSEQMYEFSKNT